MFAGTVDGRDLALKLLCHSAILLNFSSRSFAADSEVRSDAADPCETMRRIRETLPDCGSRLLIEPVSMPMLALGVMLRRDILLARNLDETVPPRW